MSTPLTTSIERAIETDLQAHIEDTRLYWICRNGRMMQRAWNELTDIEREELRAAERRACYVATFAPCGWEV